MRYRFVTDLIEKKVIEVVFVPTKENLSDGFTKNVNRDTYRAHTPNYVQAREYWNEEYEEAKVDENEQSYCGDEVD